LSSNESKGGVPFFSFFTSFTEKEFEGLLDKVDFSVKPDHPSSLSFQTEDTTKLPSYRYFFEPKALEETIKIVYIT